MANDEKIWNYLIFKLKNPYAVAAIMGNLRVESALNPLSMTGRNKSQWTSAFEYVLAVNSGNYSRESFAKDGIAFGLVQWLFWSRKANLYDFAKSKDISDVYVQLDFMLEELPKYKTVWEALQNANDIDAPCDAFMLQYERPGTVTEVAKEKRRKYACEYYNKFSKPVMYGKYVETTIDSVLVRAGNGIGYGIIGKVPKQGTQYSWVATSEDNWHAIIFGKQVGWISGAFTKVITTEVSV